MSIGGILVSKSYQVASTNSENWILIIVRIWSCYLISCKTSLLLHHLLSLIVRISRRPYPDGALPHLPLLKNSPLLAYFHKFQMLKDYRVFRKPSPFFALKISRIWNLCPHWLSKPSPHLKSYGSYVALSFSCFAQGKGCLPLFHYYISQTAHSSNKGAQRGKDKISPTSPTFPVWKWIMKMSLSNNKMRDCRT